MYLKNWWNRVRKSFQVRFTPTVQCIIFQLSWTPLCGVHWGLLVWDFTETGGYSQRWSGTATSCAASWTLFWSSSDRLHSERLWSWSAPSPWPLYSAQKRNAAHSLTRSVCFLSRLIKLYLHGFAESVGEVQLLVFEALDCEETTQQHLVHLWVAYCTCVQASQRNSPLKASCLVLRSFWTYPEWGRTSPDLPSPPSWCSPSCRRGCSSYTSQTLWHTRTNEESVVGRRCWCENRSAVDLSTR